MNTKEEAIQIGFEEITPYTLFSVEVEVEYDEDEYGIFLVVLWSGLISSKIRYKDE